MLYIISTPIGNLEDITTRAVKTLTAVDYILCEDTRISLRLLNKLNIKKKLISFHKFNEKKLQKKIITDLKNNKKIALISDAGTPLISDPGSDLIKDCYKNNIKVTAIPGACSIIQALVLSGFDTTPFQFLGFLPKKEKDIDMTIKKMLFFEGTSICFESPNRIHKTIAKIAKLDPKRNIAILRELTKKFEEKITKQAKDLEKHLKNHSIKGEIVLAVEKGSPIDDLSIEDLVSILQTLFGLSLKEAMKKTALIKKISKKKIYDIFKK